MRLRLAIISLVASVVAPVIVPGGAGAFTVDVAESASAPARIEAAAAQQPRSPRDDDTLWGFFKNSIRHADTPGKWLALPFFMMLMAYVYLPRLSLGIVVVVGGLALVKPQVRDSRLVRIGLALFGLGFVTLTVAGRFNSNPLGAGFLFAFTSPLAAVMMTLGALKALLKKTDTRLNRDIAALIASAEGSRPIWPDEPPLPEVDRVATHGARAGSALVALLAAEPGDPSSTNPSGLHVEQQAELALCKIYRVLPTAGETIRDARSTPQENSRVTGFWRRKVS